MENTYVVYDETNEAVIIDPGCYEKAEMAELDDFINANELKVVKLLNTHCHIDHVLGNAHVCNTYDVGLEMHKKDLETLRAVKAYAPSYGFNNYEEVEPESFIEEGQVVKFGNSAFETLFVPGHAPGHIAFVNKEEKICLSGDVLFNGSIGRTDLPGGNFEVLIESIKTKVFLLDEDVVVYSGHGENTTIGQEMRTNPFCKIK